MPHQDEKTSIRIVSVDYYMSKPDPQFDSCYSEFRGSEVKQVPVVRLFGSSPTGTHSCVHIHGVLPYFYIPYEGSTVDRLTVDQRIYQLASALDKAINISLGQSTSRAMHVFSITLVKGTPIYGYHKHEHHFLKVHMYNPLLIRKATQLLMNGTILSTTFQVHETHVPYILQFFIDYNLYGMSFMHLQSKGLRQRKEANSSSKLAGGTPKMSTSEYEIDALASAILNRKPLKNDSSEFANPGIASIWADEQARRRLCGLEQPESSNLSQSSGLCEVVTESDRFYRALLVSKLSKGQHSNTVGDVGSRIKPPVSSYPSEVAEGESLVDASFISHHSHSSHSPYSSQQSLQLAGPSAVVDEEKIIFLSQNHSEVTLCEEDMNMIEIMRELEENENQQYEGDCVLAPLTQRSSGTISNISQAQKRLNASLCGDLAAVCLMEEESVPNEQQQNAEGFDSDDEFLLDLTQKQSLLGNDLETCLSDSEDDSLGGSLTIPQLDGGDDSTPSTKSAKRTKNPNHTETQSICQTPSKRARMHLNRSCSSPASTPRRVSFANPISVDVVSAKRTSLITRFEASSPVSLKPCVISVPMLDVSGASPNSTQSPLSTPIRSTMVKNPDIKLKNVFVHLEKMSTDTYQNFSPQGTPVANDATAGCSYRKRSRKLALSLRPPTPKRPKYEPQKMELILSERFQNIIRLSPKVRIEPLSLQLGSPTRATSPAMASLKKIEQSLDQTSETAVLSVDNETMDVEEQGSPKATEPLDAVSPATMENDKEAVAETPTLMGHQVDGVGAGTSESSDDEPLASRIRLPPKVQIEPLSLQLGSPTRATPPVMGPLEKIEPSLDQTSETAVLSVDNEAMDVEEQGSPKATEPLDAVSPATMENDKEAVAETPTLMGHQVDEVGAGTSESSDDEPLVSRQHATATEENGEDDESPNIVSFCERTLVCELDDINTDSDDSLSCVYVPKEDDKIVTITPTAPPPSFEDASRAIESFEIPAVVNRTPFYSDAADVTGKKEVGHTVLHIPGNSLNDMEDFRSTIGGLGSLNSLRYDNLQRVYGDSIHQALGAVPSSDRMKELLSSDATVSITPAELPPNHREAESWVDARCRGRLGPIGDAPETDSPVKVKKAETIMTANLEGGGDSEVLLSAPPKIDSDSTFNLSVLVAGETPGLLSTTAHIQSLVTKNMSMNTFTGSPADSDKSSATGGQFVGYKARKQHNSLVRSRLFKAHQQTSEKSDGDEATEPEDTEEMVDSSQLHEQIQLGLIEEETPRTSDIKENLSTEPQDHDAALDDAIEPTADFVEHSNANISMVTPVNNTYGFKVDYENLQKAKAGCEYNCLTILSLEVHVQTRGDLRPNPSTDPLAAIFYRIHNDVPPDHPRASSVCGIILNQEQTPAAPDHRAASSYRYNLCPTVADVLVVPSERDLYEKFLLLISFWDPDIFAGYEIESVSWGYIIERGYALEMNLMKMLSRVPTASEKVHVSEEEQQELLEMHDYSAGLKIPGRILLDIWRLMRHEIALTSYTFENVAYHILHRRVPCHSHRQLTGLWVKPHSRWIVLDYYLERVNGNFAILNQLDLIGRTAELAKLFGIQFYEVLSRGSQFRVESMMLRIAKPRNLVSVSPSIQQRAHMRSPEYLPLILEPQSRFYADPMIVLDFQSLYPSVIIAYNYCFSTCLGRIEHLGGETSEFEFGATHLRAPRQMVQNLLDRNLVSCSPCGVAFVKSAVREGVLPRMLSEILNTRLMVKKSMKLHKDNSILQRVLHSRQLGLKLIANVTYGYTAANFSGRMPCVEIGDSVVAKGRETLERAIKLVEGTERWGAKVVYGDTDSLFVLCPGRTREEAFRIGEEIAATVTAENPPPVKLKLEKVYQPAILQTKKRYVGFMYESADQKQPTYEAKGIETVRRDGCPVVAKMLEKVLRILFETCDVSKVKQYTCRQFAKILEGRVNLQDFIFAKEFRGADGYKPGACVPALELSRKWKLTDPRREPRRGQRVPYVIVNGPPLVPLIRLVRSPDEVLANEGLKINANYYIVKAIIPPLNRCLLLIGADVNRWYNDLPRKTLMLHNAAGPADAAGKAVTAEQRKGAKKSTISQYFSTTSCVVDCGRQTHQGVCKDCCQRPQYAVTHLMNKVNKLERKLELTEKMCRSCCQRTFATGCVSLDCPVMFSLNRRHLEHKQAQHYVDLLEKLY
ncbi:DNA polymerase zeta catalytic subunit [Anopheles bellator]|uniref:DNA polymerase zeta catalytic subunit n=1 Tax=Anopheles bellator TaxID=139047 RepID=UPI00264852C0|nr:DNA polymerase zeta catalytic subunit [Anopheles bellator]